jgi:hypothetical protein
VRAVLALGGIEARGGAGHDDFEHTLGKEFG